MEEPSNYRKNAQFPHPEPNRGKPFTHFLFKALLFASIIVVVPLFPSQAPEFIAESLITKFWELIHLLFIGIAVSYGLFCRRNAEIGIETESRLDSLQNDMSRMFHVSSSRCEDGYDNPYGFGEKRVIGETVVDEQWNLNPNFSSTQNSNIQAWNSQYFQGESMVVVARPNCGFSELGESRSVGDYKPLGLPVRSLRSRIRKRESSEVVCGNESGSGSLGSYSSFDESGNLEFGDLGPQNLERRFDDAVASPSPIPWCSRSGRMETREKLNPISRPAHFRPLSVDETQFESLGMMRTPSLRSTVSFSSHASSMSSSQGDDSPSCSVASVVTDSEAEDEVEETSFQGSSASSGALSPPKLMKSDVRKTKSNHGSSDSLASQSPPKPMKSDVRKTKSNHGSSASLASQSPPKPMKPDARKVKNYQGSSSSLGFPSLPNTMDDKASSSALHTRGYSFGSLYDNDLGSPKDYLKELRESSRDDVFRSKESEPSFVNPEAKLASPKKASLRGKSVRTIRSSRLTKRSTDHGGMQGNQVDDVGDDIETEFSRGETTRSEGIHTPTSGNTKQSFDNLSLVTKLTLLEDQAGEVKEFSENVSAKPEEQAEIKAKMPRLSLDSNDVDCASVQGTRTPDSNEVDKKAGEFIAKFREQIRLQKVASMERSRGLRFGSNYIR